MQIYKYCPQQRKCSCHPVQPTQAGRQTTMNLPKQDPVSFTHYAAFQQTLTLTLKETEYTYEIQRFFSCQGMLKEFIKLDYEDESLIFWLSSTYLFFSPNNEICSVVLSSKIKEFIKGISPKPSIYQFSIFMYGIIV